MHKIRNMGNLTLVTRSYGTENMGVLAAWKCNNCNLHTITVDQEIRSFVEVKPEFRFYHKNL